MCPIRWALRMSQLDQVEWHSSRARNIYIFSVPGNYLKDRGIWYDNMDEGPGRGEIRTVAAEKTVLQLDPSNVLKDDIPS